MIEYDELNESVNELKEQLSELAQKLDELEEIGRASCRERV